MNKVKWIPVPKGNFECPNVKKAWVTLNNGIVRLEDNLQMSLWGCGTNIVAYSPINNVLTSLLYITSLVQPPKPYNV